MKLKAGVIIQGIRPELVFALNVADRIYKMFGEILVITSLDDGKHSKLSLHYSGAAADLRTRYFDEMEIGKVADMLRSDLGVDFDVVIESDHIHLEYQPKRR